MAGWVAKPSMCVVALKKMGQIFPAIAGAPGSCFELVMSRWACATSGNPVPSQSGTIFLSSTIHSLPPQRRVYERSAQEFGLTNVIPLFNTYRFFSVVLSVPVWPTHLCCLTWDKCWLKNGGARLHGSCWLKQSIVKSAMCYASKLCHRVKRSFLNSLERAPSCQAFWGGALQLSHPQQQPNITWNNCRKKNK